MGPDASGGARLSGRPSVGLLLSCRPRRHRRPAGAAALPAAAATPASVPPLPAASAATCAPSLAARRGAASSDLRVYAAQFAVVCVALFLLRPPFASARRPTGEAAVSGRVVVTIAALSVVATAALARMRTPS